MTSRPDNMPKAHKIAETGYLESTASLSEMEDFLAERNYPKALESLEYAIDELYVVRDNLYKLVEKKR